VSNGKKDRNEVTGAQLQQIIRKLDSLTDWKKELVRGLVRGIGATIGATLVAGILLAWINSAVDSVNDIPVLKQIIDSLNLDERLNEHRNNR